MFPITLNSLMKDLKPIDPSGKFSGARMVLLEKRMLHELTSDELDKLSYNAESLLHVTAYYSPNSMKCSVLDLIQHMIASVKKKQEVLIVV